MNHREIDALMAGMAPVVSKLVVDVVAKEFAAVLTKFAASAADIIAVEVAQAVAALPKPENGKDADPVTIGRMVADAVAALPVPQDGRDADPAVVVALVAEEVGRAVAALPKPENGKDADPVTIGRMVADAVAALPVPQDGRDADPAVVVALVAEEVGRAVAALPKPENGKDADPVTIGRMVADAVAALPVPQDGRDADPAVVVALVAEEVGRAVAALPKPENGKDADPVTIGRMVADAVAALPVPQDGRDADPAVVVALVAEEVGRAVAALPKPENGKDGVNLAGAVIDRDGNLIVTLSDGSARDLGRVVGNDVDMAAIASQIEERFAEFPTPKDGVDGLGFDEMSEELADDGRTIIRRYSRGAEVKEFRHTFAVVIDRGVYREGETYRPGDGVSFGGSWFIKRGYGQGKPGESDAWRLAVKRGRDGKDGGSTKAAAAQIRLK